MWLSPLPSHVKQKEKVGHQKHDPMTNWGSKQRETPLDPPTTSVIESAFTHFFPLYSIFIGASGMVLMHFFLGRSSKGVGAIMLSLESYRVKFFLYLFEKD